MKTSKWIPWVVILLILVILGGWFVSTANRMVALNEGVQAQWSQVENVYQRRADLIPNLVNTVKGYATHEAEVLEKVTQARSQVGQVQVNANDAGSLQNFEKAQGQLSGALSRLMVVVEKYPDLKATPTSRNCNRSSKEPKTGSRLSASASTKPRGTTTFTSKVFPQASLPRCAATIAEPYFQAAEGAQSAPKVQF